MADRNVTTRRTVQQIKHCVEEALSIIERAEDLRCAHDDLRQAYELTAKVLADLKASSR